MKNPWEMTLGEIDSLCLVRGWAMTRCHVLALVDAMHRVQAEDRTYQVQAEIKKIQAPKEVHKREAKSLDENLLDQCEVIGF